MKLDLLNVLVTGGAGYLGSHLVRKLLSKGYNVRVLDSFLFGDDSLRDIKNSRLDVIKGDIRHIEDIANSLKDIDAVIHLAAIVGDPACEKDPGCSVEVNIESTKALLEMCKHMKVRKFIFASTCSVYGASDNLLTETSELNPLSLYALSKLHCEQVILEKIKDNDLLVPVILRLATLQGLSKRMRFDLVLNIMTAKAVKENKIIIDGGEQWRPLLHVEDAADAFIQAMEAEDNLVRKQIFNVGDNSQNFQIGTLGKEIISLVPSTNPEYRDIEQDKRDYKVSFDKINNILNFKTQKTILNGIKDIKMSLERGEIENYKDDKYYNVKYDYK
jgi:nucleoside-diphosphate-sugar epimerase